MVIGLGTGSTADQAIKLLGELVANGLKIRGIPTSNASRDLALSLKIPLTSLDEVSECDLDIDGADEVSPDLQLIKGGGGALLREKIVAYASRKVVIVVDSQKKVDVLGQFPLPVEIIPFALKPIERSLKQLGAQPVLRMRTDCRPFITDEGHHILDCHFGAITDPAALSLKLKEIPGIVEHGLFIDCADMVVIGSGNTTRVIERC